MSCSWVCPTKDTGPTGGRGGGGGGLLHVLLLMVSVVREHDNDHVNVICVSYAESSDISSCTPEPISGVLQFTQPHGLNSIFEAKPQNLRTTNPSIKP